MQPAVTVRNLSKHYRLGESGRGDYGTLRESVMQWAGAPIRRLKRTLNGVAGAGAGADKPGSLWALKDVSFDVKKGESVGIIGRNGAGKSTLLKLLSRITGPTAGSIQVRGRLGSLLEVGTGFHPELTGRENIFLNGAIMGMTRREIAAKYNKIVEFSEVGKFIDTPVKRYSSGMYVKLAFAVAAHMEPDILLIDEVLSVGDLAFQRKCMDYAQRLLKRNATLLFVSHNMFTVKAMCDRAIYLTQGQVTADGGTEDVTRLYDQESGLDIAGWARGAVGSDPGKCPISITAVELLNEAAKPRSTFDYGQRMRLRMHYEMREPVESPNFNVAIIRSDNVACCNYNTAMDHFPTASARSRGVIELLTPPLKLVSELYSIQVLVWDSKFQRLYCAQVAKNFHVRDTMLSTQFGVFHEEASWRWCHSEAGIGSASL
ncbi:MAG TPA: ABC transporter ATP-binding protein [Tepidisphaeraceae bacterium]|jgi:lipopolysaccharide transport system ATP-binding protein